MTFIYTYYIPAKHKPRARTVRDAIRLAECFRVGHNNYNSSAFPRRNPLAAVDHRSIVIVVVVVHRRTSGGPAQRCVHQLVSGAFSSERRCGRGTSHRHTEWIRQPRTGEWCRVYTFKVRGFKPNLYILYVGVLVCTAYNLENRNLRSLLTATLCASISSYHARVTHYFEPQPHNTLWH